MVEDFTTFDKGLSMTSRHRMTILCIALACVFSLGGTAEKTGGSSGETAYLFFTQGTQVGRCDIRVTQSANAHVFESVTEIRFGEDRIALENRTEYDKKTLRPLLYRYKGERAGESLSGTIRCSADSVRAQLEAKGQHTTVQIPWTDDLMIFQNYVPEHLLAMARRLGDSGKSFSRYRVLFPSDMMATSAAASAETEIEVPIKPPVVCTIYAVGLENSPPFYLYYDIEGKSLIYIDFPATQTEVFLERAFEGNVRTKYKAPPPPDAEP